MATASKKIAPGAYNALADALPLIYWNKNPFERHVRGALSDAPELLANLDFNSTKREISYRLVDLLMANEGKYQDLTLSLMISLSEIENFPNLTSQQDSDSLIKKALQATKELQKWTNHSSGLAQQHIDYGKKIAAASAENEKSRILSEGLAALNTEFMNMFMSTDAQRRGLDFERFLNNLFRLYDLEPRAAYSLKLEQIDGAFSFETDDYILEARWWKDPIGRDHLDIFKAKVGRKGKNALGLCISVSGFTSDALAQYSDSTPFIVMEGTDLLAVLEGRVRLDDLLRRKKRHANETGHCYFPAKNMF